MVKFVRTTVYLALVILVFAFGFGSSALCEPARTAVAGHVPAVVARLTPKGRLSATNHLSLNIGLPLRNEALLDELLRQLYDPTSTNFHKYLTPSEFAFRFGPTETDYQAVINFAQGSGLRIAGIHPNRAVLDVEGTVAEIEQAFAVSLKTYRHPAEGRDFFAPNTEPSVPAGLSVVTIEGLSDYGLPKPLVRKMDPTKVRPLGGSGPGGYYAGNDFRKAYVPGSPLTGTGQVIGLLEFSDFYPADITAYENTIGLTNFVPLNTVVIGHPGPTTANNVEVALDIEVAIAMAPGLSQIIVYEIKSGPSSILSRMANDNLAKQLSSSWTWNGGPSTTVDNILKQMATQGQSFFQASGDDDAYTGAQTLDNSSQLTAPVDSTNLTSVGGTMLTMTGVGGAWSSEAVWNYHNVGGTYANVGSGGGISAYYPIPYWQKGVSMTPNSGSTTFRNVPDVALTADSVYVIHDNGGSSGVAGTSAAAPLWAGFCALVNQQSVKASGTTVGFLNPALYAIGKSSNYANCFHDITSGNNIGTNTPGLFSAVTNYDLCTGLGTPNGTNLINALAPARSPSFVSQPSGQSVTNGANVALSGIVDGQSPLTYRWLFNGTNLAGGGNIAGVNSNVLSITSATTNNAGNYRLVATNQYGAATSSIAILTVGFGPAFSAQPSNLTILSGSNAQFNATVSGSSPLVYQWRKNGTNLVNGAGISGATSNILTLSGVTTNSAGNYSLFATNSFGLSTSSVASLTVVLPPAIIGWQTAQSVECGSNLTFNATVSGTPPLGLQWSLDGSPLAGATNTSLSLVDVHFPNHSVSLSVVNPYGSAASNATLTVHDTLPPLVNLNGSNPSYAELGTAYSDAGATANDVCAGPVAVAASGMVDTSQTGTNSITYTASDGNGNSSIVTRTVIVRDATPPTIVWSFTNLTLAAETNCATRMPDVTGTNFILASDLSGTLAITQTPTNDSLLSLGTNIVIITVKDGSGNAAYSTNFLIISDETPPLITLNGADPLFTELGSPFLDPGATANDSCVGSVQVLASGTVNTNEIATNTIVYTAADGNGNSASVTRTVIVRDTTPPTIVWSFTNLTFAAETNCAAPMPDVTGTNFIVASDLSGPVTISQNPTNNTLLTLGTNSVMLTVQDAFGNTASAAASVIVQETSPPLIVSQPQSRTNLVGTSALFEINATACTAVTYQWLFNGEPMLEETNSTLGIASVGPMNGGSFSVIVTGGGGSITSSVATLSVNLLNTTLALTSSVNPSGYQDVLSFTAAVSPADASGQIDFLTNGVAFDSQMVNAGHTTSINILSLPRGTNLITAIYLGNSTHLPASNTLVQVVTNHPPNAANTVYTRIAGNPLGIAVAELATNWMDVDTDLLSLANLSISTNGITLINSAGTLLYSNSNDVADQFTCTIDDGWGGVASQTVNITVTPAVDTRPLISGLISNPGGSVTLGLGGAPGHNYILEATTNLNSPVSWSPVSTNTIDSSGVWKFQDAEAINFGRRFYRLKLGQ